ncbi:hypothetical protein C454_00215 [Haloferax gibbonsii ATCC 33959]|uniref:SCP domain-containing protein n=1 Tax=Haloferax gibbonsii (strain ATCC 33959 / DSM 4427 / JCM 8863 / NBRC 102184 / NCIMB 2188 / Ma 2.38) TaxID=1227459 RepID=M0HTB1_HALGM|nr:CAP domain-containing protein [Haloferax gibbonsii]ELZ86927.1 hypothetical protein C454_00215 [Haloferax gibbonsii ATCC 33959]
MDTEPIHVETLVHHFVNEVRTDHGLSELAYDKDLERIARAHSEAMADRRFFSHTTPDGRSAFDRYVSHGYWSSTQRRRRCGENISRRTFRLSRIEGVSERRRARAVTELARTVVDGWMGSAGHRRNVLGQKWEREGVGAAIDASGSGSDTVRLYVTQNFA